jgi:EAL domain-containing protein (putative c-di-GMP-specific phosphodiesterase class I)
MDTSDSAEAIVRGIVGLGANLGLVTTAEGVETFEQLADLRRFGCIEVQGYFFSRPRPNSDVPRLLRELHRGAPVGGFERMKRSGNDAAGQCFADEA